MKVVLDWDGTVTKRDSIWMFMEEFGDQDLFRKLEEGLGTTVAHRDVMEKEMATVTTPLDEVAAWLVEHVEVRDGFHELAERFSPVILSMGFHETIEPILAREGVELEVVANRLDPQPDGWRVLWRDGAQCPVCDDECKRSGVPADDEIVYIGDGYSDRCAVELADRVFARDSLADYLDANGRPYERFDTLGDVASALS